MLCIDIEPYASLICSYLDFSLKSSSFCAAAGLRSRSPENKAEIVKDVEKHVWPAIAAGKVKPVIYKSLPLSEAAEGHKLMESSTHIGKILLIP